ncbi:thioredoxin family protein [Lutimonas sp.]|uniref:thioredoxin family protein n=1 Tax=Lutimonas sp. TaxID=1872403 RepID=UPI003D9ACF33
MANTASNMLPLDSTAAYFELLDSVSDRMINLNQIKGKDATVVFFICNHCPFVIHVNQELVNLARDYQPKGVGFVAISSNDVDNYPQDGPALMKQVALKEGYSFPYLYDETQEVALAYQAACTPDFFVFDKEMKLKYRGQLDDSRPGNNRPVTGADLRNALDLLLAGKGVTAIQKPSMGCNIKWKHD